MTRYVEADKLSLFSGQVAPGTQEPIEVFYVVSKTAQEPTTFERNVNTLASMFAGTGGSESNRFRKEHAIFTDRTSADNFAKRQRLYFAGINSLRQMSTEQLEEIVPALDNAKVEDTIELINHHCD